MVSLLLRFLPHILIALAVAGAAAGLYVKGRADGSAQASARWLEQEAGRAEQAAEQARLARLEYARQAEEAARIADAAVKTVERVRVVTKTIVERVYVEVPRDLPLLPSGVRVLHDGAATGTLPDPAAPGGVDAAPVAPADLTATVIANYGTYHEVAARLTALQRYVSEVCRASNQP